LKNTSLPQKASKSIADVVETSQVSNPQGSKQEFALIPIVGSKSKQEHRISRRSIKIGMTPSLILNNR